MFNARQHRRSPCCVVSSGWCAARAVTTTTSIDSGSGSETTSEDGGRPRARRSHRLQRPRRDHGWLAAITENAEEEAAQHDDVEFVLLEGTNDSAAQVSQASSSWPGP
jgi:ribose transport system substrate-binding protein